MKSKKLILCALIGLSCALMACNDDNDNGSGNNDTAAGFTRGQLCSADFIPQCDGSKIVSCINNLISIDTCSEGICGNMGTGSQCIPTKYGACTQEGQTIQKCEVIANGAVILNLTCKKDLLSSVSYFVANPTPAASCPAGCATDGVSCAQSSGTTPGQGDASVPQNGTSCDDSFKPACDGTTNKLAFCYDVTHKIARRNCQYRYGVCANFGGELGAQCAKYGSCTTPGQSINRCIVMEDESAMVQLDCVKDTLSNNNYYVLNKVVQNCPLGCSEKDLTKCNEDKDNAIREYCEDAVNVCHSEDSRHTTVEKCIEYESSQQELAIKCGTEYYNYYIEYLHISKRLGCHNSYCTDIVTGSFISGDECEDGWTRSMNYGPFLDTCPNSHN